MGLFSKLSKNKQEAAGQDSGYYSKADDQAVLERARSKRATSADGPAARRSRNGNGEDAALPEKKRARRRLVGAIALALGVAIGLPMLLDSEPKPLASDIAIQIPSQDKPAKAGSGPQSGSGRPVADVAALDKDEEIVDPPASPVKAAAVPAAAATAAAAARAPQAAPAPSPAPAPPAAALAAAPAAPVKDPAREAAAAKEAAAKAAAEKLAQEARLAKEHKAQEQKEARERADAKAKADHEQKLADAKADAKAKAEHEQKLADAKAEAKARAEADAKAKQEARAKQEQEQKLAKAKADAEARAKAEHPKSEDSARAMAILEDKPSDARYMVQVAAVTSQEKVDELQSKLKEAGIKSFTQKVNTAGGSLTRIRVGPFSSKDEAEKVRAKLSKIGLSSSLATS